ncbi:hypothetical protein [Planktothrix sp.]|uniref:hypothetical protein n=2 Tax=Planktothrix sp. TaxID=3088171 RepID=UPI0038D4C3D3
MSSIPSVKQEILNLIEQLPENKMPEVLQFVNFLIYCQNQSFSLNLDDKTSKDSQVDPLAEFIGAVTHGSLAQNIDQEIYE